jgi:tol-pal system protein YbgF
MMKPAAAIVLAIALAGCASQKQDDGPPSLVPPAETNVAPANDARVVELQTSMTEMLERIDVLNARIAKLESGAPAATVAAVTPQPQSQPAPRMVEVTVPMPAAAPAASPSSPLRSAQLADAYRNALMLYGKNKLADARAAFQQVFDSDPSGDLADNALYWIGETWFAAGDYSAATRYYGRVIKEYGEQNKAPDAMFKTGIAFEKTGDLAMARKTFQEVLSRYPYSTPAASAKLELQRIKY